MGHCEGGGLAEQDFLQIRWAVPFFGQNGVENLGLSVDGPESRLMEGVDPPANPRDLCKLMHPLIDLLPRGNRYLLQKTLKLGCTHAK